MCSDCGCGTNSFAISGLAHGSHLHAHTPPHEHGPRTISIEQDLLAKNNHYAAENRRYLKERGIFALNFVSSPGSGKTSLLTQTVTALRGSMDIAVIEGDQQTERDADRIRATGVRAVQVNTGKGCHLDAQMIGRALDDLALEDDGLLLIENVGNLVCPAAFDLGEAHKVVILSVTEGDDKPLKYPDMFRAADMMLLNKVDLLPYVDFDKAQSLRYARTVNPGITVQPISATQGDGMISWLSWIHEQRAQLLRPSITSAGA